MSVKQQLYFPTPIYNGMLEGVEQLNKSLIEHVYAERERDAKGVPRSTYSGLKGWHSRINLHKDDDYRPLLAELDDILGDISRDSGYHPDYDLEVTSMWGIINPPGSSNRSHIHPGCVWSGVYYLQTPDDCGNIEFLDPRVVTIMNQPKYRPNEKRPKSRWTKVNFTPKPGKVVVFPAWLYHSVAPNLSQADGTDGDRVIISFNISQNKRKKRPSR